VVLYWQAISPERVGEVVAKGNIGNLLQHFVALRVAQRLIENWGHPDISIEYIDCYSMAPWEPVTGRQPQGFVDLVRQFPVKRNHGDFVASVFLQAWWDHYYAPSEVPGHPQQRNYPNTAVLLRTGFPKQKWNMRLHEDDSTEAGKFDKLSTWASQQNNGNYEVHNDWTGSPLILNRPVPNDRPALIMLDPFQIVSDRAISAGRGDYLPASRLQFLVGQHALSLQRQAENNRSKPIVLTLFSYSDANPQIADRIVREQFPSDCWHVEWVQSGPWQGRNGRNWHVGWIVSTVLGESVLRSSAQEEWNRWVNGEEN
jgi:hypothetical protein